MMFATAPFRPLEADRSLFLKPTRECVIFFRAVCVGESVRFPSLGSSSIPVSCSCGKRTLGSTHTPYHRTASHVRLHHTRQKLGTKFVQGAWPPVPHASSSRISRCGSMWTASAPCWSLVFSTPPLASAGSHTPAATFVHGAWTQAPQDWNLQLSFRRH